MQRPSAVAVIPGKQTIIIGAPGHIATYDAVTNVRHSQFVIPKNHTPRLIQVLPSKTDVAVVCAEWTIYIQSLRPTKPSLIMDLSGVKKKPLMDPVLCYLPASSSASRLAVVLVAAALKDSIRSAYLLQQSSDKAKGMKELQPGFKLSLEKGKGVMAMASHPYAPIINVLTVNGELQLYQHTQGAPALTPLFQFTSMAPHYLHRCKVE
jgi:hypothetical protein